MSKSRGFGPLSEAVTFEAYGDSFLVGKVPEGYIILQDHLLSFSLKKPVVTEMVDHHVLPAEYLPGLDAFLQDRTENVEDLLDQPCRRFWDLHRGEYQN